MDNREETLRELEDIFPQLGTTAQMTESGASGRIADARRAAPRTKSFEDTVRDYLLQELCSNHEEVPARRGAGMRAETLLGEVQA